MACIIKKCENIDCNNTIELRIGTKGTRKGQIIKKDSKKRFCSKECLNIWQRYTPWEERIGIERSKEIRTERSIQFTERNPSTNPQVAAKIGKSLAEYLKNHPEARTGENNPFYGKHHTEEHNKEASELRKGRWSCVGEAAEKHNKNTPRGCNHPNWKGGVSNGECGVEFTQELKLQVKQIYNYACQLCMIPGTELQIHHIDYNKTNNSTDNLIPLCPSCRGKTNYHRENWIIFFKSIVIEHLSLVNS